MFLTNKGTMKRYRIYGIRLQNNHAKEPEPIDDVLATSKKKAVQIAYKEFAHLLPMYWKDSLFAIWQR